MSDLIAGIEERRQVEIAVGVLMGLSNCSQDEALRDFGAAVRESPVKAIDLATALIEMADDKVSPRYLQGMAPRCTAAGGTCCSEGTCCQGSAGPGGEFLASRSVGAGISSPQQDSFSCGHERCPRRIRVTMSDPAAAVGEEVCAADGLGQVPALRGGY
ncbi:ANTAR domain-containing protein [Mycolicibacterium fluoranthenivorans]|uniref:ANTAR domain-containing protein n=1 Tax=Mycolicibacterium fluoranthenivorans TaxID=258505 RepID=A0A7X5TYF8_9MYCO|nr:ANTAR domain-containing protein [Mycolicibacterium fluoranthenivorans]MCV7358969.1 ANTAR domain-containing protein [Mycolicibacterium fluoranthenivorans]NIH95091.1 hypothetical protein [Mycolicibacterium fluoranthenivorans]